MGGLPQEGPRSRWGRAVEFVYLGLFFSAVPVWQSQPWQSKSPQHPKRARSRGGGGGNR